MHSSEGVSHTGNLLYPSGPSYSIMVKSDQRKEQRWWPAVGQGLGAGSGEVKNKGSQEIEVS